MNRRFFSGVRHVVIISLGKSSAQNAQSMHAHTKPLTRAHIHTQRDFVHNSVYIQMTPGDSA